MSNSSRNRLKDDLRVKNVRVIGNGASPDPGSGSAQNAVKYIPQVLTTEQQAQARVNIGAPSSTDVAANSAAIQAETQRAVAAEGALQQLIAELSAFSYVLANQLPTASADTMGAIYLVPSSDPQAQNVKDEYITVDNGAGAQTRYTWEQIGSTAVNIEGCVMFTPQSPSSQQKAQARANIEANEVLVSGVNIKTINQTSILGSGDIAIPKGDTGDTGPTPNFSIGTVTTGAAGTQAAVSISGTPEAPVLNLTIPKGDQGNTGSSVEYPYELVNNRNTNDATKGLSAAEGYRLGNDIGGVRKNYTAGQLISTGVKNDSKTVIVTDKIPVSGGDVVVWYNGFAATSGGICLCLYDETGAIIDYYTASSVPSREITVPSESSAVYLRASMDATNSDVYVSINNNVVWTKKDWINGLAQIDEKFLYINRSMGLDANFADTDIFNGTELNAGNANFVKTQRLAVTPGHTYTIDVPRPLVSGHKYIFGYTTYSTLDGEIYEHRVRAKDAGATPYLYSPSVTISSNEAGLLFIIGEVDETDTIVPVRESSFIDYRVTFVDISDIVKEQESKNKIPALEAKVDKIQAIMSGSTDFVPRKYVTWENSGHSKVVYASNSLSYLPIDLSAIVSNMQIRNFKFEPSTASAATYFKVILFDDQDVLLKEWTQLNQPGSFLLQPEDIPSEAVSGFIDAPLDYADELIISYNVNNTVTDGENDVSEEVLLQFNKEIRSHSGEARSEEPLVLLHFSDIHGGTVNLDRIKTYYDNHKDYISDVIHTGDALPANWSNDFSFWGACDADEFLNVIGNHDTAYYDISTGFDWTRYAGKDAYDRYFLPYISEWGVEQPANAASSGLCYYYKDYHDVRLIVLDDMSIIKDGDSAQLTWLSGVLDGAKVAGKQVIIAAHYPNDLQPFDCPFHSIGATGTPNTGRSLAVSLVDSFITAGGTFVAWLTGHTHYDLIGTVRDTVNPQVTISVSTAMYQGQAIFDNIARVTGTPSMDLFNIVKVDPYNKRLSLFRVGSNFDSDGRHIGTVTVDYSSGELVNYW